jgi:outer membrane lipoprotein SlyB
VKNIFFAACLSMLLSVGAQAQHAQQFSPKAQLAADSKAASAQYEADKSLCNDEATSRARLQCRRDAKADYDEAIAAAKARMAAASPTPARVPAPAPIDVACADCGKVTAVSVKEETGKGGATGLIAGGVGGALLGHQVGGGRGKDLATVAGAVGGAYAGHKIEEKMTARKVWSVAVQYQNGTSNSFVFDQDPGFRVGDRVKNAGTSITRQ